MAFFGCASAGKKGKKGRKKGGVGAKTRLCPACYKRSTARLASRTARRVEWGEVGLKREPNATDKRERERRRRYREKGERRVEKKKEKKGTLAGTMPKVMGKNAVRRATRGCKSELRGCPLVAHRYSFRTGRHTRSSLAGDKYTGEFTASMVVTSSGLFQVNRAGRDSLSTIRWREVDANDAGLPRRLPSFNRRERSLPGPPTRLHAINR